MKRTAIVENIRTCPVYPSGKLFDIVRLSYDGGEYYIATGTIGEFRVGQEVDIELAEEPDSPPPNLRISGT